MEDMTVAPCQLQIGEDLGIFLGLRIDVPFAIHYLTRLQDEQQLGP